MHYAQERHRRRSPRLPGHDYAQPGGYFVTICSFERESLLCEIVDDEIRLNTSGEIVQTCWRHMPDHHPHVQLDAFVIMPNHVHGIIHILNEKDVKVDLDPGASANVGAGLRPARPVPIQTVSAIPSQNSIKQPSKPTISRHPLPEIVRAFKSFSSRRINETQGKSGIRVWQRGFYEHIIRDEDDLHRIRQYIVDNPVQWATDKYYCR